MDARLDRKDRNIVYEVDSDAGLDKKRRESGTDRTGENVRCGKTTNRRGATIEGTGGWSGMEPAQGCDSRRKRGWYAVTFAFRGVACDRNRAVRRESERY
jgi:hypothetical protein